LALEGVLRRDRSHLWNEAKMTPLVGKERAVRGNPGVFVGKTMVVKEDSTGVMQSDFSTQESLRRGKMFLPKSVAVV
jgi:hypothetical protein